MSFRLITSFLTLAILAIVKLPVFNYSIELGRELSRDPFGRPLLFVCLNSVQNSLKSVLFLLLPLFALTLLFSVFLFTLKPKKRNLFKLSLTTLSSLPGILVALTLATLFSSSNLGLLLILALELCPRFIRIFIDRIEVLEKGALIESSIALGGSRLWIALNHGLRELGDLVKVKLPEWITLGIITETTLSFFGLSKDLGQDNLGLLLYFSKEYLIERPEIALSYGIFYSILIYLIRGLDFKKNDS